MFLQLLLTVNNVMYKYKFNCINRLELNYTINDAI